MDEIAMVRVGGDDVAGDKNNIRKCFGCGEELELLSLRGVSEVWSSDAAGTTEYPENSQTPELPVAEATAGGRGGRHCRFEEHRLGTPFGWLRMRTDPV